MGLLNIFRKPKELSEKEQYRIKNRKNYHKFLRNKKGGRDPFGTIEAGLLTASEALEEAIITLASDMIKFYNWDINIKKYIDKHNKGIMDYHEAQRRLADKSFKNNGLYKMTINLHEEVYDEILDRAKGMQLSSMNLSMDLAECADIIIQNNQKYKQDCCKTIKEAFQKLIIDNPENLAIAMQEASFVTQATQPSIDELWELYDIATMMDNNIVNNRPTFNKQGLLLDRQGNVCGTDYYALVEDLEELRG